MDAHFLVRREMPQRVRQGGGSVCAVALGTFPPPYGRGVTGFFSRYGVAAAWRHIESGTTPKLSLTDWVGLGGGVSVTGFFPVLKKKKKRLG